MSDEEKDIQRILLQINALAAARRNRLKNSPGFLKELDSLIDTKPDTLLTWKTRMRLRLSTVVNWIEGGIYRITTGHDRPSMDITTIAALEELHERQAISRDEIYVCTFWRVARRTSDGHVLVSEQPRALKILGYVLVVPIFIGLAYSLFTLLNLYFAIWTLAFLGYPIGAALGKAGRFLFFSTWGWNGAALKLKESVE